MMMKRLLLPLMLLLAACASAPSGGDPQATVTEFLHALGTGDPNIGDLFTVDATVFFPMNDAPLRANGRDEIAAVFAGLFTQPGYKGSVPPSDDLRVERFGDAALITFQVKNPNVTSRRTFVLRVENGKWRIAHLHGSNMRQTE
jgi:ketosteroid isomerase-like protein